MGQQVTIGGERIHSGNKMKTYMHGYERSTHDMSYVWRSTMAAGTLVPSMVQLALPGDTWDIEINADILTKPTVGPLFGSFKFGTDIFIAPIRLWHAKLNTNLLGIGMEMDKIALPQLEIDANEPVRGTPIDNQQINPSCILSYLNIRGLGTSLGETHLNVKRFYNGCSYIMYWETIKNYYVNKQEEIGAVIHKVMQENLVTPINATLFKTSEGNITLDVIPPPTYTGSTYVIETDTTMTVTTLAMDGNFEPGLGIEILYKQFGGTIEQRVAAGEMFGKWEVDVANQKIYYSQVKPEYWLANIEVGLIRAAQIEPPSKDTPPQIVTFPLVNIDDMKRQLLRTWSDAPFVINNTAIAPYGYPLMFTTEPGVGNFWTKQYAQEGLALKTYQSDLLNNWVNDEWISGPNGVAAMTAIDTTGGSFTMDTLNFSQKLYNLLSRIALTDGSYDSWQDAIWDHRRPKQVNSPMFMGGLIKELVFQEVVSTALAQTDAQGQPLGTLAGRGKFSQKHKGGKVTIRVDEPSYIMAITHLTPRLDYSQGNQWDVNLKTMDDLHKPALDGIGYQDLLTDKMAWWDTKIDMTDPDFPITFRSAGKQPAWIDYMTNINQLRGNFANDQEGFMVLDRNYEAEWTDGEGPSIKDLTTYVDPSKFNYIFADTRLDAQNYWVQIGFDMTVRRKISAKQIPNL